MKPSRLSRVVGETGIKGTIAHLREVCVFCSVTHRSMHFFSDAMLPQICLRELNLPIAAILF